MLNQAIRYLCDHMDSDGKYKQWNMMKKMKNTDDGVVIRMGVKFVEGTVLPRGEAPRAEIIAREKTKPRYKQQIDKWLGNDDDRAPLIINNLELTSSEINELKLELKSLHVMAKIESSNIKIIKI